MARRRRSIIREFAENTSTHGIPGIARSTSLPRQVFWTVSFLCFTGIMCYFIAESFRAFAQYPTQTLVNVVTQWPQNFAAVTVCNYSPLRNDRFSAPFLAYLNSTNTEISRDQVKFIPHLFRYKLNRNESLNEYFYPLKSMLISCQFNGHNCSATDFVYFLSSHYGMCYTFNSKSDRIRNGSVLAHTDYGGSGVLALQFYLHSHQYVPYFADAVGLVATIHDNTQMPWVATQGLYFGAGRKHYLSYARSEFYQMEHPYSNCRNEVPYFLKVAYGRLAETNYSYSVAMCFGICTQMYIYTRCGCISPYEWAARSLVLPGTAIAIDVPLCALDDPCYSKATDEFINNRSVWGTFCSDCTPECHCVSLRKDISSLDAPMEWMFDSIKDFVESSSIPVVKNWSDNWRTEIRKNYIGLNVQLQLAQMKNYTAVASMGWIDLISNIGGHTGLWIGLSFLSMMELIEMLMNLFEHEYSKFTKRFRKVNGEERRKNRIARF